MKNLKTSKHSHNNRESTEGKVLRFVREFHKMSLVDVAQKMDFKGSDIEHFENGRRFYTESEIENFLSLYQLSKDDFKKIMSFKVLTKTVVNHYLMQIYRGN